MLWLLAFFLGLSTKEVTPTSSLLWGGEIFRHRWQKGSGSQQMVPGRQPLQDEQHLEKESEMPPSELLCIWIAAFLIQFPWGLPEGRLVKLSVQDILKSKKKSREYYLSLWFSFLKFTVAKKKKKETQHKIYRPNHFLLHSSVVLRHSCRVLKQIQKFFLLQSWKSLPLNNDTPFSLLPPALAPGNHHFIFCFYELDHFRYLI